LGGAAADENFQIGNGCPVTEVSVVYEFLQDVQRVVATSFETVPPRSVLHRLWIPPDNFEFRHTSFLQARSGQHIDRHCLEKQLECHQWVSAFWGGRFGLRVGANAP